MTLVDHAFERDANPRHNNCCGKCGRVPSVHPPCATLGQRDPEFEREFMRGATKIAGIDDGWSDAVHDRMQRMEREKGTSAYLAWTIGQIVTETDEEGLDLGGWPVLGALLAYRDIADDDTRLFVQSEFQQIAALGVLVRLHVNAIREALR